MHKILKSYLKRLTNLTVTNRSLLLLRLSEEQDMDLNDLDFVLGKSSFSLIEGLLEGKKEIVLCPEADSRNAKVNELSGRLKKIDRREKFIFEERGARDLNIGWPFVNGKFTDGTPVRCPLLFFPVTLYLKDGQWTLRLREDIPPGFNKSFLLAYGYYNQIAIPDELLDFSFDDFDKDSQVFRTQLYSLMKESPLEINFNQDLFVNKLQAFPPYKKADFEELYGHGEIKLLPEAVLGLFPQAGSYLVPDYNFLIKTSSTKDLEAFFYERSGEAGVSALVKEEHTVTPFPIDASQEHALVSLKKGKSLVVQGPPGTGKSQLICNLIADYIARGKNVLLVCQKRAALDVVYDRLRRKDLKDFAGLVHDVKNDRRQVFEQIASQIERLEEYRYLNSSLDAIHLERSYVQISRRIEQLTEELDEFRKILFDEKECGLSVKELYLTTDPSQKAIDIKQDYKYFNAEEIRSFSRKLGRIMPYAETFEKPAYLWKDRVSFASFSTLDKNKLLELLDHIPFYQSEVSESIREILGTSLEMEDFEWLLDRQEMVLQLVHLLEDSAAYNHFMFLLNKATDQDWFIIREKQIMECFKGSGIEISLPREQLGNFQRVLEKAQRAKKNLFKWLKWHLFSKEKFFIKRVCVANKLKPDRTGFEELVRRVDNRMNLEHNLTELRECGWLADVPESKEMDAIADWIHHQQTALGAKAILKELRNLKDYLNIPALSYQAFKSKLTSLVKIISAIPAEKQRWQAYLTPRQVGKILNDFAFSIELAEVVEKDFESLAEYDRMKEELTSPEKRVLEKLLGSSSRPEEAVALFENSVKLEWIESIELKYPVLRSVSSQKMEQMEKELQECVEEKSRLSAQIMLMKVREKTYLNVTYNRLDNMVTYRDLKHQVTKKKKLWPLRKLLSEYGDEVFRLVPCWLASPESVSSLFPMEAIFDLVIFDEASQCYAENGIPAMYRGRQLLVTGDDKQLAPSDVYRVKWEEEDESIPELELDSLLELGKKYLQEVSLKGHYRSRSLDLIDFSNRHFYKGRLQALPDYKDVSDNEPGIRFVKVEGIWEHQCNREEAAEVVSLIRNIYEKKPGKTIGVVTFNYRQQMLIQDMLEENGLSRDGEFLFVKNIENVQGDEKDMIIFSIGYAPDKSGRMSMQFGSLNMENGENRLNVAVTRAREKVYVVSSITPQQLDVSGARHEGPRLLKAYLQYAMDVSAGHFKPVLFEKEHKSIQWYLKNALLKEDFPFSLAEDLPFADLTVMKGKKRSGLINTDDDLYYRSLSSKEAYAYLPIALLSKNWKFKRVYSRHYWENKEQVKEGLIKTFGDNA